jgi:hypothetical protein
MRPSYQPTDASVWKELRNVGVIKQCLSAPPSSSTSIRREQKSIAGRGLANRSAVVGMRYWPLRTGRKMASEGSRMRLPVTRRQTQ